MERISPVRCGIVWQVGIGLEGDVAARHGRQGTARIGQIRGVGVWQVWCVMGLKGKARLGEVGQERNGMDRRGTVRFGRFGMSRTRWSGRGWQAWREKDWIGLDGVGFAGRDMNGADGWGLAG